MDALQTLAAQYRAAKQEADRLIESAADQAGLDAAEEKLAEAERLSLQLRAQRCDNESTPRTSNGSAAPAMFTDPATGKKIAMLSKGQSLSEHLVRTGQARHGFDPRQLSLGKVIVGKATGRWHDAEAEKEFCLAQGGFTDSAGGFLVPDELSSAVIDRARAISIVASAGAQFIPMQSDVLKFATVASDPVFESKAENVGFTGTSIAFGQKQFFAWSIGNTLEMSRELADDSPNFASLVTETLAKSLAVALDNYALNGTGVGQPMGLASAPTGTGAVGTTGSIGGIVWEDLSYAVRDLALLNQTANAVLLGPQAQSELSLLTGGDGSTAEKSWLPAPPPVGNLPRFVSTNVNAAHAYIGNFEKAAFGVRMQPEIMITPYGSGFAKFALTVRIVWRGDFQLLEPTAFWKLTGLTH